MKNKKNDKMQLSVFYMKFINYFCKLYVNFMFNITLYVMFTC